MEMASAVQIADYGKWESPITAELLSGYSITLNEVQTNPKTGAIYVIEGRPAENGRCCIVEYLGSETRDILPEGYNARSRIHEYGGGAFAIGPNGTLIFTDWETNGIFALSPSSGDPKPLIHAKSHLCFADFSVHPIHEQWILAVQEDRSLSPIQNSIVAIEATTKETFIVTQGADFYSHPRFNHDGTEICWTQWSHPDMAWNGTELFRATWHPGTVASGTKIAGAAGTESICQPRWGPDGTLFFVSDRSGYWQLYRINPGAETSEHVCLKGLETSDFGEREFWLGNCTYVSLTSSTILSSYTKDATSALVVINLDTNKYTDLPLGLVDIQHSAIKRLSDSSFVVIGASEKAPRSLYLVEITEPAFKKLIKSSIEVELPEVLYSTPQMIEFPRVYGEFRSGSGHAIYLPPNNPAYQAPAGEQPPLIVSLHGGPTSHVSPGLLLETQYWTSRGYAYVHVNYAGSTGYGRAYRDLLKQRWGVIDDADAASCVAHLISLSYVNPAKIGIVGASAGGYTVLQALCGYPDVWAGGVSYFGIGNLKPLAVMMHKFESYYIDQLLFSIGTPLEDQARIFEERSPYYKAGNIASPILLLQGTEDTVVPPSQAIDMERMIKETGGTVKLVLFEGEGHGFRQMHSLKTAIVLEEEWWRKTLL
ncbi:hypothetical protein V499_00265 [Pseudogymnoascus sp. VKM F-103]|nr:hypothetical protein V499_00265 [Pseudogymnoascus sp. VKM F-103]